MMKISVYLRSLELTLCVVVLHFACSSHTLFFTTFQQFGSLASDDDDDGPWKKRFRSRSVWSTRRLMEKYICFFCVLFLEFLLSTLVSRQFFLVVAFFLLLLFFYPLLSTLYIHEHTNSLAASSSSSSYEDPIRSCKMLILQFENTPRAAFFTY